MPVDISIVAEGVISQFCSVADSKRCGRPGAAGIFPFRLGGQSINPTGRNQTALLFVSCSERAIVGGIEPGDAMHGPSKTIRFIGLPAGTPKVGYISNPFSIFYFKTTYQETFGQDDDCLRAFGAA